jgi:DNA-binding PadR family transcriptional regulator
MTGTFLAEFELYVMLAVAGLRDEAYGAAMRREIEERTGRPVSIGALYATLGRLEEKGLVIREVEDPEPGQRGRPRKYCRLTPAGEEALRHSTEKLRRMMDGVSWLTRPAEGS